MGDVVFSQIDQFYKDVFGSLPKWKNQSSPLLFEMAALAILERRNPRLAHVAVMRYGLCGTKHTLTMASRKLVNLNKTDGALIYGITPEAARRAEFHLTCWLRRYSGVFYKLVSDLDPRPIPIDAVEKSYEQKTLAINKAKEEKAHLEKTRLARKLLRGNVENALLFIKTSDKTHEHKIKAIEILNKHFLNAMREINE